MRLVTIDKSALRQYVRDPEMLQKANRPAALVVQLVYNGRRHDFAVPLRSNITGSVPKNQYFPLPPRPATRPKCRHGIHYIKMFPVKRSWLLPFHTENNMYAAMIKGIIDRNEKQIVKECKEYLARYEAGIRPQFATDLDLLLSLMDKIP